MTSWFYLQLSRSLKPCRPAKIPWGAQRTDRPSPGPFNRTHSRALPFRAVPLPLGGAVLSTVGTLRRSFLETCLVSPLPTPQAGMHAPYRSRNRSRTPQEPLEKTSALQASHLANGIARSALSRNRVCAPQEPLEKTSALQASHPANGIARSALSRNRVCAPQEPLEKTSALQASHLASEAARYHPPANRVGALLRSSSSFAGRPL